MFIHALLARVLGTNPVQTGIRYPVTDGLGVHHFGLEY